MKMRLRTVLKKIYKFLFEPFFKNGVRMDIGGAGRFRFDYIFAFSKFEAFGSKHNAGFKKWLRACRDKKVIFDIGAHIGLYSIPASAIVHKEGVIYAFEPSSANRAYLERHKSFNNANNITVLPFLVGEKPLETVNFYENRDADAMNSIFVRKNRRLYNEVSRQQVSLDDFCTARALVPEIVKIDVEGAELKVLRGAGNIFKKHRPVVFLSIHPRTLQLLNQPLQEVLEAIDGLSYRIYDAEGKKTDAYKHNEYILIPKERTFDEIFYEGI